MSRSIHFWSVLSILVLGSMGTQAQENWELVRQSGSHFRAYSLIVQPETIYNLQTDQPFNSLTVKYAEGSGLINTKVSVGERMYDLEPDPHAEGGGNFSALIHLDQSYRSLVLRTGDLEGDIEVHLINSKLPTRVRENKGSRTEDGSNCHMPTSISQQVWRSGLTLPNTSRSFSDVSHLIVHHSAGSNIATNYTEVVRAIYIFHTESRGWSDIGYNYLIAPDGSLFLGRDPVGQGAQDEVIGAHFCGMNTGTMGICMLGTYTDTSPTTQALSTLEDLLAWKVYKDLLIPTGTGIHQGILLPVIAGHRDGCATECPGQVLHSLLDATRSSVQQQVKTCDGQGEAVFLDVYPNPVSGNSVYVNTNLDFKEVNIIDAQGKLAKRSEILTAGDTLMIPVSELPTGMYFLNLSNSYLSRKAKIIIQR